MIDYVKIYLKDYPPSDLLENPQLTFFTNIDRETGEIRTTNSKGHIITPFQWAEFNGLKFIIYDTGTITITGSIHKYWNGGIHNYNDFYKSDVSTVLRDLKSKFNITPGKCVLKSLEIGINITPPIETNIIIESCFLHKTTPFESVLNRNKARYIQAQHSQYKIKIYNKALHYQITGKILRFEIKYTKMEKLNKVGIITLKDLMDYGLKNFKAPLLREWNNILYYDNTINFKSKKLLNYSNPRYWISLKVNNKKSAFNKNRNDLRKINLNKSANNHKKVAEIIIKKIDLLNS